MVKSKPVNKSSFKKTLSSILFIILFAIFASFLISYGQDLLSSQSLEVSPPSQEINVDPGQTITIKASLRNKSKSTLPIKVRVEDFTAQGEEGQVALIENSQYSITGWTKITPDSFSLEAGESQEVSAKISVPESAAGGRYGSFVFSVTPEGPEKTGAAVSQEIASLFLVKITGPVDEMLALEKVSAPSFSEYGPVEISLNFKNSGNIHTKTFGLVTVTNMFGKKVADIVVPGTNVFPGSIRILKPKLDKKFLFGQYKALALMNYGATNQALIGETTFMVFPYKLVIVIIIILLILYSMRKRLKKASKALFS